MGRPHTAIRTWLERATPEEARQLAKRADTSVPHLRHIAAGRRNVSADLAQRLAHASQGELKQRELCEACRRCPIAEQAALYNRGRP